MKFYLLFPLLFLAALSLPIPIIAQDKITNSHSKKIEAHSDQPAVDPHDDLQKKENGPHAEVNEHTQHNLIERWSDHLPNETESFESKFFNMLFVLGLLIGFMILASWALKRMMKSKVTHLNTASMIKVLETRYLSPRATLYLVEVQNQNFLIAESPTTVAFLKTSSLQMGESPTTDRSFPKI